MPVQLPCIARHFHDSYPAYRTMSRVTRPTRPTRPIDWIVSALCLGAGLFFFVVADFSRHHGTTPKNELTVITGIAISAKVDETADPRSGQANQYLWFTVGDYTTEWG